MANNERIAFVQKLVSGCLAILPELTGKQLYTYQLEMADRIFFSLLYGDAEEITVECARQSGKSETLADVAATAMVIFPKLAAIYPEDPVIKKFKGGIEIGCFAPIDTQADTIFSRIVDRLSSDEAKSFMMDPEIADEVKPSGNELKTKSGSVCRRQTAHATAKIESKTYHLIIIDEAQEADSTKVRKSIHPMAVATAGSIIKVGTPAAFKSDFYEAIQRNKHRGMTYGKKNHFAYDWKRAAKENPYYAQSIRREKERLGEDSDEFQMSYCQSGETRILTADLKHIRADEVTVGMRLAGFDEERPSKGLHRRFRESIVEDVAQIFRPCYRLGLDDGTEITCSAEHQWLVLTAGRRTIWKKTEDLVSTDQIIRITDVWDEEESHEQGYLAAAFDGEGWLSHLTAAAGFVQLGFAQKPNAMLHKVRGHLDEFGFRYWESEDHGVTKTNIAGGRKEILRFLGQIRPVRLLDKLDLNRFGSIGQHERNGFQHPHVKSLEFLGSRKVVAIRTTSRTYIAEGLASHNCLKWLLDRGMFITEELVEELGDKTMKVVPYYTNSPVVIGIDVAKTHDSTVCTAVWVDWEHPDEFGLYQHRILSWLELHGEDWESQYAQICDFVSRYYVMRIGVDAQGMGDPVAERLGVLLPNIEVIPMAMNPIDQSERWQHLLQLIQRKLIGWPAHPSTRKSTEFRRFTQQLTDVEKEYKGKYLMVAAPKNEKNAHDDYIDSLALACFLTKEFGDQNEVEQWNTNPLLERHPLRSGMMH